MRKEWLVKRVDPVIVEKENTFPWHQKPFGDIAHYWVKTKMVLSVGGELWEYNSPPETWERMCGEGGFCVVRNDEIVYYFTTVMN